MKAFWITPDNKIDFFNSNLDHSVYIAQKYYIPYTVALKQGYTRGWFENGALHLTLGMEKDIREILNLLPEYILMSIRTLEYEEYNTGNFHEITVEDEDVFEALNNYQRRQHLIRASFKFSSRDIFSSLMGKQFWLYSDGTLDVWDEKENIEHLDRIDKSKSDGKGVRGLISQGNTGRYGGSILYLNLDNETDVGPALEKLPHEWLLVNWLIIDFIEGTRSQEIKVDEGEDAWQAWFYRNSIRKRVNANLKFSGRDFTPEEFISNLKNEFKDVDISLYYTQRRNELNLMALIVPKEKRGQGIGSNIMRRITDYTKVHNIKVVLSPSTDFGASSKERLKKFYKGFGFVENKNRNKDLSISDTMYTK